MHVCLLLLLIHSLKQRTLSKRSQNREKRKLFCASNMVIRKWTPKRNILKLFFVRIFWWKKNHSEQWIYLYHYLDYYYVDYHASLLKHLVRNKTFNKFEHFIAFPAIVTTTKYNMHCHVRLNSEKFIKNIFFTHSRWN